MTRRNPFNKPRNMGIRLEDLERMPAPAATLRGGRGLVEELFRHDSTNAILEEANRRYSQAKNREMDGLERARAFADAGILFGMGIERIEGESGKNTSTNAKWKQISAFQGAVRHYALFMKETQGEEHMVAKREFAETRMRLAKALSDSDLSTAIRNAAFAVKSFGDAESFYRGMVLDQTAGEIAVEKENALKLLRNLREKRG